MRVCLSMCPSLASSGRDVYKGRRESGADRKRERERVRKLETETSYPGRERKTGDRLDSGAQQISWNSVWISFLSVLYPKLAVMSYRILRDEIRRDGGERDFIVK